MEIFLTISTNNVHWYSRRQTAERWSAPEDPLLADLYYESDADPKILEGQSIAVLGYGNQGRSWSLNLRDSDLHPRVCVRADESRERAREDGFETLDLDAASDADVVCVLVPDDTIPGLPLERKADGLTIVASGYALAFDRFQPAGDLGMVAPRMLGPEVRLCYEEGVGFISAVGIQNDVTGHALGRTLAVARAIGGLKQGALALTPMQEAVLDLAVEQVLSPALTHVNKAFVQTMLEQGIPMEAIMTELVLSGEVERSYRLLREEGFAAQMEYHSPTSQYGQLSRRGCYDDLDFATAMQKITEDIASGRFADEWDEESRGGYANLKKLKHEHCGPGIREFEAQMRRRLGSRVSQPDSRRT
jgi:ketol-acid reductoisomerase